MGEGNRERRQEHLRRAAALRGFPFDTTTTKRTKTTKGCVRRRRGEDWIDHFVVLESFAVFVFPDFLPSTCG